MSTNPLLWKYGHNGGMNETCIDQDGIWVGYGSRTIRARITCLMRNAIDTGLRSEMVLETIYFFEWLSWRKLGFLAQKLINKNLFKPYQRRLKILISFLTSNKLTIH